MKLKALTSAMLIAPVTLAPLSSAQAGFPGNVFNGKFFEETARDVNNVTKVVKDGITYVVIGGVAFSCAALAAEASPDPNVIKAAAGICGVEVAKKLSVVK